MLIALHRQADPIGLSKLYEILKVRLIVQASPTVLINELSFVSGDLHISGDCPRVDQLRRPDHYSTTNAASEFLVVMEQVLQYHLAMNKWQIASAISTIVQGVVVIVSLIFIWRQIQLQTKQITSQTELAKAANTQALVGLSSPFNIELIKDPQMAKLWLEGAEEFENYSKVDRFRFETLLFWWLILHENVYYQKQKGFLDNAIYAAWEYDLRQFVERQQLQLHWEAKKNFFQQEFKEHVNQVMQELQSMQASHNRQAGSHQTRESQ